MVGGEKRTKLPAGFGTWKSLGRGGEGRGGEGDRTPVKFIPASTGMRCSTRSPSRWVMRPQVQTAPHSKYVCDTGRETDCSLTGNLPPSRNNLRQARAPTRGKRAQWRAFPPFASLMDAGLSVHLSAVVAAFVLSTLRNKHVCTTGGGPNSRLYQPVCKRNSRCGNRLSFRTAPQSR